MKPIGRPPALLLLALLVTIVAVACGGQTGSDGDGALTADAGTRARQPTPTPGPADPTEPATTPAQSDPAEQNAAAWRLIQVGEGIKPAIAVDAAGVVHVAFLTEADHGGVFYANNQSGEFQVETVSEGYFYGPLDLALGPDGAPFIAYHDHQDLQFDPALGDEVVAMSVDGQWMLETVADDGHDGWDNAIVVDGDGNWHTAAVDPAQFGSDAGVEYATNAGGSISVTEVGSGPVPYEFGTSIGLGAEGRPGIAYYDADDEALAYASFDGSNWSVEVVDDDGNAGRYPSLTYDAAGAPHIAYFVAGNSDAGTVRHAWRDGEAWVVEEVDVLEEVRAGQIGARKITSLAVDDAGTLHIAYTDRRRIVYGQKTGDGWEVQELPHLTDQSLGQLVELAMDGEGRPHLTWFEVTSTNPLSGPIVYARPQ